jgi:hypothetical protein
MPTLKHPPYSPDLAPPGLYLFPRLKSALKRRSFCDSADIKNATEELERLSQTFPEVFQTPLQSLEEVYACRRKEGNAA